MKVILELGRVLTIDIHKEHGVRKVQEKRIDCFEALIHKKMTHSLSILANREGYLPPEGQTKEYDLSLDIHMFGVIMVQIVEAVTDISSAKVRHELINKIEESHPLKKIINSCTMVDKEARPTAINVSKGLQDLL